MLARIGGQGGDRYGAGRSEGRWRERLRPRDHGWGLHALFVNFEEPQLGPAGLPIEIRLQGADPGDLKGAADAPLAWLGRYRGAVDLSDDLRPGKPELRLRLRAACYGTTAAELQVGPESFGVFVQLAAAAKSMRDSQDGFC